MSGQAVSNEQAISKLHWSFWPISILSLIWYLMSCMNFVWQWHMTPEKLAMLSEAQSALIVDRPVWATLGFAVASVAGVLGCLLLLLKRFSALYFLLLSLIGVVLSMVPVYRVIHTGVPFSAFEFGMYVIATPLLGLFLVWYAKHAKGKGWLR